MLYIIAMAIPSSKFSLSQGRAGQVHTCTIYWPRKKKFFFSSEWDEISNVVAGKED